MLLLRGYEQWCGISFLGDHFRTVAKGRTLYVIVLFCVGSAFVVMCHLVLVCGRQYLLPVFYRVLVFFVMRVLMPLLRLLTWMRIYRRKALLDHRTMIMIFSGYTLDINISMAKPDQREWVPIYLCENPSLSLPKES